MEPTFDVLETIERQIDACRGPSPLYAALLTGLAADYVAGGPTRDLLEHASERPQHDAIPLRYLGTGHRLALAGRAPGLAAVYPSCGGEWDGSDVSPAFLDVVRAHRGDFAHGMTRQVQTNEIGRAVSLVCGMSHVMETTGLPLRLLEVGASAGLLSRLPWYRVDAGRHACGPDDAEVRFAPEWFSQAPHRLVPRLEVVEQAACDLMPIDITTEDGRITIQSFVWPDQQERIARLRHAIDVALRHPLHVVESDAGEWLAAQLANGPVDGAATVVFHSIVWQYLPQATRATMRTALAEAGAAATHRAPLAWLRLEPSTPQHADLRVTVWPSGEQKVLARVGYHGQDVIWHE